MGICMLSNICKSFGKKVILHDFSLQIERQDFVCITGKSGSGKSTLLNIMGLLESADSGKIDMFDKFDVKPSSINARLLLRNHIGFLFQNFALLENKSVSDNWDIALQVSDIPKSEWQEKKLELLETLSLNVRLKTPVHQLSGGEQQRISIGRILLKKCELILADEPTGSLDEENRDLILALLSGFSEQGKAVVIVSHDSKVADHAKKVISLP